MRPFSVVLIDNICLLIVSSVNTGHAANCLFLIALISLVFTGKNSATEVLPDLLLSHFSDDYN